MKKTIIGLIIFLCIFTVFAVGCTYLLIHDTSSYTLYPEVGIDLDGTYNENDIVIESLSKTRNGIEINIPVIKGLKNTSVQDKINEDMHKACNDLLKKHSDISYTNYYTSANFSNVVSITFNVGFDYEPYYETVYFNYNLVDGNELKLEDLFIKDTDLLEIVRPAFYECMALYGDFDYENNVHSPNEEKLFKTVKSYMAEGTAFTFSASQIYFHSNHLTASVKMIDMPEKITIYSKYLTNKNLYTGEYEGIKNIFTCADSRQYNVFDKIEYGLTEDNLWYDICYGKPYFGDDVPSDRLDVFTLFSEAKYNEIFNRYMTEYRAVAKENPDKFYIVFMKPSIRMDSDSVYINGKWHYTYFDTATVNDNFQVFEMPIELYNTVYKDKLVDSYRYEYFAMRGGVWLDTDNTQGATVTESYNTEKYNYITKERIYEEE